MRGSRLLIVAVALFWLAHGKPVSAQTCTASASTLSFGTISTASATTYSTTATIDISCTGENVVVSDPVATDPSASNAAATQRPPPYQATDVRLCPYLGGGTYGADTNGPRLLGSDTGRERLSFDVFTTPRYDTRYPNDAADATTPSVILTVPSRGTASTTITVYARIPARQNGAATGDYTTTLVSGVSYDNASAGECGTTDTTNQAAFSMQVSATNIPDCTISTSPVAFGAVTGLGTQVDAIGAIGVTCSAGANYTVSLDGGANGGRDAMTRRMVDPASRMTDGITYGLYSDSGRTRGWYTDPSSIVGGTGSGSTQLIPVYGRVPAQATPSPGDYADTVIVTLSY